MSHIPEQPFLNQNTSEVADHQYSVQDYEGQTQVEQGTAETHEQISDVYMTGNHLDEMNR